MDRIFLALTAQESGGNHTAENVHTQATGLTQILPENIEGDRQGWDWQYLKRDITVAQLKASPELQEQLTKRIIADWWKDDIKVAQGDARVATRRIASRWCSGRPDLHQSCTPQILGGVSYPSIAEYADKIEGTKSKTCN